MSSHARYIRQTYALAQQAAAKGNHPFGALLVLEQQIVGTAENTVVTAQDVTRHAELNLVRSLSPKLSPAQFAQSSLYTSTEPCAMCTGALFWAGIREIVYGCSAHKLGEIAGGGFVVPCRELLQYGQRPIQVVGPVLEAEGAALHRAFW